MSNIDNFDIVQMSSKFAQGYYFVCNFYCKKISTLGSLDNAENANCLLFYWPPYVNGDNDDNAQLGSDVKRRW